MNKEELVKEIAEKAKLSQKATGEIVGAVLETIQKTVSKGKKSYISWFRFFWSSQTCSKNRPQPSNRQRN